MNKSILKEDRNHGDLMFPLNVYTNNPLTRDIHLDLHWHSEMEFLILREGKATFQIEDKLVELCAGEAIFVNSKELHAGYQIEQHHCIFDAIVFSPTLLYSYNIDLIQEKFIEPFANQQCTLKSKFSLDSEYDIYVICELLKIIDHFNQKSFAFELIAKATLYNILTEAFIRNELIFCESKVGSSNYKLERLKSILDYIYTNYYKSLNLRDLSQQFNMSEGHFCRFFKEMTRKTPIEFINHYRINEAAKILISTDEKISHIALEVGFDNIGYFISTFKKQMKCTPSEYRKINMKIMA